MNTRGWIIGLCALLVAAEARAFDLQLPTANDAFLQPGGDARFYQPTVEGTVESGMFGCVRRGGSRFHEGVDIKCLHRDKRGESTDPIMAVSDGVVAFINSKSGLSNYGRYIILRHVWDGVEVHTLYAHLREIASGLAEGQPVRTGQVIGVMGRSTNTREGITPDRAHLHFEVCFLANARFDQWYRRRDPKAPPFGNYNGQNFFGIDAVALFRARVSDPKLNFSRYMAKQPIGFTVLLGARPFSWLNMHPEQIQPTKPDVVPVAYEVGVTAWGVPIAIWPRGSAELSESVRRDLHRDRSVLLRVNDVEIGRNGCRDYIRRAGSGWEITNDGREWLELFRYNP
jgi:murein DD-endopeptidase MepM/ murein hydrolase activator NlpD